MALVENWYPLTRENWQLIATAFQYFPVFAALQWFISWYGQGKTSVQSRFNLPGKLGWATMEAPGFLTVLYCMYAIPRAEGIVELPRENKIMAGLFTIHYIYRALLGPLLSPSMSPIHIVVWFFALCFQIINGLSIGGWLAGYGPRTRADWSPLNNYKSAGRIELGMMIFFLGLAGNIFHDEELREIRRSALRRRARDEKEKGKDVKAKDNAGDEKDAKGKATTSTSTSINKHYMLPRNGLFPYILYPHYLLEWLEWCGFWLIGGAACTPARTFVVNEIATMLPRALQGRRWYIERFGRDKVGSRRAVIPGLL